jgi:hypothetical protein
MALPGLSKEIYTKIRPQICYGRSVFLVIAAEIPASFGNNWLPWGRGEGKGRYHAIRTPPTPPPPRPLPFT